MQFPTVGTFLHAEDPRAAADFYVRHLGFELTADIGWFTCAKHPDHPGFDLAFVSRDHESLPASHRGTHPSGVGLAFLCDDVDAQEAQLRTAGLEFVLELRSEPWGQRRFQVAAPDGVVVELLQLVDPDPEWMKQYA